jgi:hypothetical protein
MPGPLLVVIDAFVDDSCTRLLLHERDQLLHGVADPQNRLMWSAQASPELPAQPAPIEAIDQRGSARWDEPR